ncbi:MAG: homocysteine S-methyltransferase family protein [Pseudomonadota bacterium]
MTGQQNITILDGGLGQEVVKRADEEPTGLWSTKVLMESPEIVEAVHNDYFAAGAEIATAATYSIHRDRLQPYGVEDQFVRLHQNACECACRARDRNGWGLVAGSAGPLGWSYRPDLVPAAEVAAERYIEIASIQKDYVDFFICETVVSVEHAAGALMGVTTADKPVWLSLSVDDSDGTLLRSGEPVSSISPVVEKFKPECVLVNCSQPEAVSTALSEIRNLGTKFGAYANGFFAIVPEYANAGSSVDILETRQDLGPQRYAEFARKWIDHGASVVGGCCDVGPEHIRELSRRFSLNPK